MKTLIFSDLHASDQPNPQQLALLQQVISAADSVIINGDFWDHYVTTFDRFLHSDWQQLFPLLKQRNTIYLMGNHDPRESMDERWQRFADRLEYAYELRRGKTVFKIEHGHQHAYAFDLYFPNLTRRLKGIYPFFDRVEQGGHWLTPVYRAYLRKAHDDQELRQYAHAHRRPNQWHIFSHTHKQRKDDLERYLNPGQFRCGIGNWLTISDTGAIRLHTKAYYG